MNLHKLLINISAFAALPPLIFALWNFAAVTKKNLPFLLFLIVAAVVETVAYVLYHTGTHNMWLYYLYAIVEFAMLTAALQRLQYQKIPIVAIGILILINTAGVTVDVLYISGLDLFNSFSRSVESLLMIGVSLYAFYDLLKHPDTNKYLGQSALFWLALGVLTYMAGNLFLFAVDNILYKQNNPAYKDIWDIHSILNILLNIFFIKTVLCLKEE